MQHERPQSLNGRLVGCKTAFCLAYTQAFPAAGLNRRFAHSPVNALIDLEVRCRLRRQIPVWLDLDALTHLRITVLPPRRPACRAYAVLTSSPPKGQGFLAIGSRRMVPVDKCTIHIYSILIVSPAADAPSTVVRHTRKPGPASAASPRRNHALPDRAVTPQPLSRLC